MPIETMDGSSEYSTGKAEETIKANSQDLKRDRSDGSSFLCNARQQPYMMELG